jgi:hypothetical protein
MGDKKTFNKFWSLTVVLLFFGLLLIVPMSPLVSNVSGTVWTETSDSDFNKGTKENLTVIGTGPAAKLGLSTFENLSWKNKAPSTSPPPRRGHVLSTIYGTKDVMLFGGYYNFTYKGDTWVYNLTQNTWINKQPNGSKPLARHSHAMAPIYGTDKVLLFGGYASSGLSNETWVYDLSDNKWIQQFPFSNPSAREYHEMAMIFNDDKVVLFGGYNGTGYPLYTWVYDLSNNVWTRKPLSYTSPLGRKGHEMATIYNTDEIILFGGNFSGTNLVGDTWKYDLSQNKWSQYNHSTKPSPRRGHGMATMYGRDSILLFGPDNQTWLYDSKSNKWSQKVLSPVPIGRYITHGIASVYGTDKAIMFGGATNSGGWVHYKDTWEFSMSKYNLKGKYTPVAYDIGNKNSFNIISWNGLIPMGTSIKFQIRTATTRNSLSTTSFVGPDGNASSYYTTSNSTIWSGHSGDSWIQFRAYFTTTLDDQSPILDDVIISYSNLPTSQLLSPPNQGLISENKPTFEWIVTDPTGGHQTAFQLLLDDDSNFKSVELDTGELSSTVPSWTFPDGLITIEDPKIPDGEWYWKVRTINNLGLWTEFSEPFSFTLDSIPPYSVITTPVEDNYYKELLDITGTAEDIIPSSGLVKVEVRIKSINDNMYWSGNAWDPTDHWLLASGTSDWIYGTSTITWQSGEQYLIQSRATDVVNNIETPGDGVIIGFESTDPQSWISHPTNNTWLNNLTAIEGTCLYSQRVGLDKVEVSILNNDDNKYWSGNNWNPKETWLEAGGSDVWTLATNLITWKSGSSYTIYSRGTDILGNMETQPARVQFMYDDTPPESTILINDDDTYTNTRVVTLSISSDDIGSGVTEMALGTDGNSWSTWESYTNSRLFDLPEMDGEKVVYLIAKDLTGNIAEPVSDSIILDTTPPHSLSIEINNGALTTNSTTVSLKLAAADALSGVSEFSLSSDGNTWTDWEKFSARKSFELSSGDGEKAVYYKVKDNAGNIADPVVATITLDTTQVTIIDTDGDGVTDDTDAFPNDPAAAVDSDGDQYPDYWNTGKSEADSTTGLKLDAFPNDPTKQFDTEDVDKTTQEQVTDFNLLIIIVFIILIGVLGALFILKKRTHVARRDSEIQDPERVLSDIKRNILHGENTEEQNLSSLKMRTLMESNYQPGELSRDTDELVKNLIEDTD